MVLAWILTFPGCGAVGYLMAYIFMKIFNRIRRENNGKKKDFNYFEAFVDLSKYSLEAAKLLNDTLNNFNTMLLPDKIKEMHEIEHSADLAKHKVINRLFKEFCRLLNEKISLVFHKKLTISQMPLRMS